jgi:hypothetical protein
MLAKTKITVELNDGTSHDLIIGNPTLVAWDRARVSMNWPKLDEAPFLWMTWISWHHMKATGLIPAETKYEVFERDLCVAVGDTDEALHEAAQAAGGKHEGDAVDPTATTPALASVSP